tara:strand:+ start:167 stop:298 length:132 start_codon:yes stop_codon:yes gene_type:complete
MDEEQFEKFKEQVEKDRIVWELKMKNDVEIEHTKFLQGLKDAE